MSPRIATANDLHDGEVVYLTAGGDWSRAFEDAVVAPDQAAATALLAAAERAVEDLVVLDPYLMPVTQGPDGALGPTSQRERIRAVGPTTRRDLGKQAQPGARVPEAVR